MAICGRRFGKTMFASAIALKTALEGGQVFWVAPTYSVSAIGWRLMKNLIRNIPGIYLSESTRTVKFLSGGWISFKSGDRPDLLRGESLDLAILDEADFISDVENLWQAVLRPALSDRKGRALFISTPNIEHGFIHKLYLDGLKQENKEIKSFTFTSYDNPHIDPKEIDSAKEQLPSIVFEREFLARFVSASGALIKPEWIKIALPPDHIGETFMAVDLAISEKSTADYTAVVTLTKDSSGNIYILDAKRTRAPFNSILEFIKAQAATWKPVVIGIESVQYQLAVIQELLRTTYLPVIPIKPDKDKISRFVPLQARFEQGLVYVNPNIDPYYLQELQGFPVGQHDDLVDATAYAYNLSSKPMLGMS